jgi:DNA replication protein DnaC
MPCEILVAKDGKRLKVCESCALSFGLIDSTRLIGFPPIYENLALEKCAIDAGNEKAVKALRRWAEGNSNIFLFGQVGVGKTYLASAAMNSRKSGDCYFENVSDMLRRFRESVKTHSESRVLSEIENRDAILFDDIGAHRVSDYAVEILLELLGRLVAYRKRGFLFTSNYSSEQIAERLSESVASRLLALAEPIEITGPDRRLI